MSKKKHPLAQKNDYSILSKYKGLDAVLAMDSINVISVDPATDNLGLRLEVRTRERTLTVAMTKTNLGRGTSVYENLTELLDSYHESNLCAHVLLVERQMVFNRDQVVRISQHCISYYMAKYPHVIVIELNSKLKTRILGAPKELTKPQRKKWSVMKTRELYERNDDSVGRRILREIESRGEKLDDVSDTTTQAQAFFELVGYVKY